MWNAHRRLWEPALLSLESFFGAGAHTPAASLVRNAHRSAQASRTGPADSLTQKKKPQQHANSPKTSDSDDISTAVNTGSAATHISAGVASMAAASPGPSPGSSPSLRSRADGSSSSSSASLKPVPHVSNAADGCAPWMSRLNESHPEVTAWIEVFVNLRVAYAMLHGESIVPSRRIIFNSPDSPLQFNRKLSGSIATNLASAGGGAPIQSKQQLHLPFPLPPAPSPSDRPSRRSVAQATRIALGSGVPSIAESLLTTIHSRPESASDYAATMDAVRTEATAMAYVAIFLLFSPEVPTSALSSLHASTSATTTSARQLGHTRAPSPIARDKGSRRPSSPASRPSPAPPHRPIDCDFVIPGCIRNYMLDAERMLRSKGLLLPALPPHLAIAPTRKQPQSQVTDAGSAASSRHSTAAAAAIGRETDGVGSGKLSAVLRSNGKELGALRATLFAKPFSSNAARNALLAPLMASFLGDKQEASRQMANVLSAATSAARGNLCRLLLDEEHAAASVLRQAPQQQLQLRADTPPAEGDAAVIEAALLSAREWAHRRKLVPLTTAASTTSPSSSGASGSVTASIEQQQQHTASSSVSGRGLAPVYLPTAWSQLPRALQLPAVVCERLVSSELRVAAAVMLARTPPALVGYLSSAASFTARASSINAAGSGDAPRLSGGATIACAVMPPTSTSISSAASPGGRGRSSQRLVVLARLLSQLRTTGHKSPPAATKKSSSVSASSAAVVEVVARDQPPTVMPLSTAAVDASSRRVTVASAAHELGAATSAALGRGATAPGQSQTPKPGAATVVYRPNAAAVAVGGASPPNFNFSSASPLTLPPNFNFSSATPLTQRQFKARKLLHALNAVCDARQKREIRAVVVELAELRSLCRPASAVIAALPPSEKTDDTTRSSSSADTSRRNSDGMTSDISTSSPSPPSAASSADLFHEPRVRALVAIVLRNIPLRFRHSLYSAVFRNLGATSLGDFDDIVVGLAEGTAASSEIGGGARTTTPLHVLHSGESVTPVAAAAALEPSAAGAVFSARLCSLLNDHDLLRLQSLLTEHYEVVGRWRSVADEAVRKASSSSSSSDVTRVTPVAADAAAATLLQRGGALTATGSVSSVSSPPVFATSITTPAIATTSSISIIPAVAQALLVPTARIAARFESTLRAAHLIFGPLLAPELDEEFAALAHANAVTPISITEARRDALVLDAATAQAEEDAMERAEALELALVLSAGESVGLADSSSRSVRALDGGDGEPVQAALSYSSEALQQYEGTTATGTTIQPTPSAAAFTNVAQGNSNRSSSNSSGSDDDEAMVYGGMSQLEAIRRRLALSRSPFVPAQYDSMHWRGPSPSLERLAATAAHTSSSSVASTPLLNVDEAEAAPIMAVTPPQSQSVTDAPPLSGRIVSNTERSFDLEAVRILAAQKRSAVTMTTPSESAPPASTSTAAAPLTPTRDGSDSLRGASLAQSNSDEGVIGGVNERAPSYNASPSHHLHSPPAGGSQRLASPEVSARLDRILAVVFRESAAAVVSPPITTAAAAFEASEASGRVPSISTSSRAPLDGGKSPPSMPSILVPLRLTAIRRSAQQASSRSSEQQQQVASSAPPPPPPDYSRKVMLWNIPPSATASSLEGILARCGAVEDTEMWAERWRVSEAKAEEAERAMLQKSQWQRKRKAMHQQQQQQKFRHQQPQNLAGDDAGDRSPKSPLSKGASASPSVTHEQQQQQRAALLQSVAAPAESRAPPLRRKTAELDTGKGKLKMQLRLRGTEARLFSTLSRALYSPLMQPPSGVTTFCAASVTTFCAATAVPSLLRCAMSSSARSASAARRGAPRAREPPSSTSTTTTSTRETRSSAAAATRESAAAISRGDAGVEKQPEPLLQSRRTRRALAAAATAAASGASSSVAAAATTPPPRKSPPPRKAAQPRKDGVQPSAAAPPPRKNAAAATAPVSLVQTSARSAVATAGSQKTSSSSSPHSAELLASAQLKRGRPPLKSSQQQQPKLKARRVQSADAAVPPAAAESPPQQQQGAPEPPPKRTTPRAAASATPSRAFKSSSSSSSSQYESIAKRKREAARIAPIHAFVHFSNDAGAAAALAPELRMFGLVIDGHAVRTSAASEHSLLYVGGLPSGMTPQSVALVLSTVLKEEAFDLSVKDQLHLRHGMLCNGEVLLEFSTHEDAMAAATALRGLILGPGMQPIVVAWAMPDEWRRAKPRLPIYF